MVWMRTSAMGVVKKLYGRIRSDLEPGNYTLHFDNSKKSLL
jgi:hypothetical protein